MEGAAKIRKTRQRMTPEQFLLKINRAYKGFAGSDSDQPAACFCLMLDHWQKLRKQFGYGGLFGLIEEIHELIAEELDIEVVTSAFNERSVVGWIPHCSLRTAEKQTHKLHELVGSRHFSVGDEELALSVSLAYAEFDHRFTSADGLLLSVVSGAEHLSAAGGNEIQRIRPEVSLGRAGAGNRQILGLLMESLRKDALKVLFQPLMSTAGEPSEIFQLLPRLSTTDGSLITASDFVDVAREAGVLGVLDRWMLQRAIHLLSHEYDLQPIKFFLSQGESLLNSAERRDWLQKQAEAYPGVSGKLIIDFALEDVLSNLKGAEKFLALAEETGLEVCFSRADEHSKWDLLADGLRVDYVKMSPDFVRRLSSDAELERRFAAISEPVRKNGTKIIMPMVEDASMAANLWRSGADYMQGYMIQEASESVNMSD